MPSLRPRAARELTGSGVTGDWLQRLDEALETAGFALLDDFLSPAEVLALAREARRLRLGGGFHAAGVGGGPALRLDRSVRSDEGRWIEASAATRPERRFLAGMELLRLALNERLFLGLFGFEATYAFYAPGAFYGQHRDRFEAARHRVLSTVVYLNDGWTEAEGGALRCHRGDGGPPDDIQPRAGRLVLFRSDTMLHEVLPATRDRLSIAGWFTRS